MSYDLPPLPYDYEALEPYIDAETMRLHHDKHHATYVNNLNVALEKHPELADHSLDDLLRNLDAVPEDIRMVVRNNGGGHLNHSLFWRLMSPKSLDEPTPLFQVMIDQAFTSFDHFKQLFAEAGTKRFGSGWVWLVVDPRGDLKIISTPNQDNPSIKGYHIILGNDVWEHAYYLKYQNRRADYLDAWWSVVDWIEVGRRLEGTDYIYYKDRIQVPDPVDEDIATPS